ncbi:DNA-directed RNA polymerase I subunit 1-like [Phalaenopsis equestris]|uniref:DNA-directed RNA polymerase I subunit 1-like n=1 Tax=Phalaenopsis equestris TaxID=78828 RepID=UPI0009E4F4E3|nr:DNA-directed RNA polymerase I subunit 1-like [Phalaenopsis equestris]
MSDARLRPDEAASETVEWISFSFYSAEEVRRISFKAITKSELLDTKDSPVPDGLYDPALGPVKDLDTCKSCGQQILHCPGHYGHIELARPIYNPLLFRSLKYLLQIACFYCHNFRMGHEKVRKYVSILSLIVEGNVTKAKKMAANFWDEAIFGPEDTKKHSYSPPDANYLKRSWTSIQQAEAASVLQEIMREKPKKCNHCKKINPKLESRTFCWLEMSHRTSEHRANVIEDSSLRTTSGGDGELLDPQANRSRQLPYEFLKHIASSERVDLSSSEVEVILKNLWRKESTLCMLICDIQCRRLRNFERENGYAMFFLKALLVPPNQFRPPAHCGQELLEHPQNVLLSRVVEANISLGNTEHSHQDILQKWRDLQNSVNLLFDNTKGFGRSDIALNGIRQLLDKKEGILRQKMMGKRVNFACRSVISPDPYLAVNEIGIPPYFALRLTYPERVTPWNVNKLRQAVMNGPNFYPGATHYMERERFYTLQAGMDMRNAISRKLPTSRAVTKVGMGPETKFEAKFVYRHLQDGDIVLVNRQPTLHKPSMMAHVVRVMNGEKTIRMHYANCSTYNADFDGDEMNVHFPQDEISRAECVHIVNANKQYIVPTSGNPIRSLIQDHIVSAVLLTKMDTFLTREEYSQLLYVSCVPPPSYSSQAINFGQKISAVVVADDIQPLPPAIWKPKLLWTGKQVITAILHHLIKGREPLTVQKEGRIPKEYFGKDAIERKLFVYNNELVHGIIDKAQFGKCGLVHTIHELYGADIAGQLLAVFSRLFTFFLQMHGFTCGVDDLLVFEKSDKKRKRILENSECLSEDVHSRFTKATTNDLKDPLKLLKETEKVVRRNGESAVTRLDRMMSNSLNALTSEVNSVLFPGGLQKPFPTNCLSLMTSTGAKGGLVNMTQISSLLGQQELEGKRVPRMASGKTLPCFPPWDISSRAGGFISDRFLTGLRPQEYYFHCMAGREGLVDTAVKTSRSGYLQRCLVKNLECLTVSYDHTVRDADGSIVQFTYGEDGVDVQKSSFLDEFEMLMMNQKVVLGKMSGQLEYAHLSKSNGYLKELSHELKEKAVHFFSRISKNPTGYFKQAKRKDLMKLVKLKYLSSLVEPGEAVGVLAAQSVGEPSTQMTLNTFHLAGRGELNVTLGIPRLTEILMHAKVDIKTPVMTCPLLDFRSREDAEFIAAKLGRISLADVIESIKVSTVPFFIIGKQVYSLYKLIIKLYSPELYPPHSGITLSDCMETLTKFFIKEIEEDITKHLVLSSKIKNIRTSTFKKDVELDDVDLDEPVSQVTAVNQNDVDKNVDSVHDADDDASNDGDVDDDDIVDAEDLGADAEKIKRQTNDEIEYDDNVENEISALNEEYDGTQFGSAIESDIDGDKEDYALGAQEVTQVTSTFESTPAGKRVMRSEVKGKAVIRNCGILTDRVLLAESKGLEFEVHFKFSQDEPHVLLGEIAQKTAKRIYVKACKNIELCSVVEPKRTGDPLKVLFELYEYIDIHKIVTNNIHAMLKTYGVEAARATILNEVKGVFDAYGIEVNVRHLMLIADLMTYNGDYRPLNRLGMRKFSTSPFCAMSFETATNIITESALHGFVDTMDSPSACVSLGKIVKLGTGSFDLLQNIQL